ncbi:MAG TPA: hypothetical protein VFA33_11700 [Bryobacteraceae bacterium]|nr:hypothetical protein [Bryobacteraceae bacterium]
MRTLLVFACACFVYGAETTDWPTGNRTTPPTINAVSPLGVARGATVEMTVEGLNLAKTSAIYFSRPGVKARILRIKELPDLPDIRLGSNGTPSTVDLGPLPPRNQVTVELDVSPEAEVGPIGFRLQTPLGTSPEAQFLIEPYYGESPDREPNDAPEDAFETYTPTILVGTISRPGDVDYFKFEAKAGEELVFANNAFLLGSRLQPIVSLYDGDQTLLKEFGRDGDTDSKWFSWKFAKTGPYFVKISDYENSGSPRHFYRILMGRFPLVTSAFPLGVRKGATTAVTLNGYNLGAAKVEVRGEPSPRDERGVFLRPKVPAGVAFNEIRLALGNEPEMGSAGTNTSVTGAQRIPLPVTINGKLLAAENDFRFQARKGQKLVFDVNAARLGSKLDSLLEVLEANGKPVERATVRCLLETSTTLSDRDSISPGLRILSPTGLAVGDYLMVGGEIIEVDAMPRGPDDDMRFTSFGGRRLALLDTTPEDHAVDTPVYKVKIYPPGTKFTPNGLPVVHLMYRNDDGGPGYGKDSRLHFTAPEDGEYILRISDVRGLKGEDYAYRLTAREPEPDFLLSVSPRNPNVPEGGRIPITVTALRLDDFEGPIAVSLEGLPAGLHATSSTIAAGQVSTTLLLSADEHARMAQAAPLKVSGRAKIAGRTVAHLADPDDGLKLVALMPKPDILMTAKAKEVVLEPGGKVEVQVAIQRNNDFGGRVPVEVRNLPPGVLVEDVGLNGVLINENESTRSFVLEALPSAPPIEQSIVLSGKIETRADAQQTSYASEPVLLRVKPRTEAAGTVIRSALEGSSAKK